MNISRGKIKDFKSFCNQFFWDLTLKDNSGSFYVKKKALFTLLKRSDYKYNCQVGYSGMSSVLSVVKYACYFESYWEGKKMHAHNMCLVIQ